MHAKGTSSSSNLLSSNICPGSDKINICQHSHQVLIHFNLTQVLSSE